MITAFTHDIKRIIEVTPVQDVEGEPIVAKVYLNGCYKGIANTVRPDEDAGQVVLGLGNGGAADESMTVTIYGKNRFDDTYTQLEQADVTVDGQSTQSKTMTFDPQDYDEFKAAFSSSEITTKSVSFLKRQYQTVEGLVIGGQAQETIAVPCDFRRFPPSEAYHIVFVAEDTGVVGREILNLFGKDGYGFDACNDD